MPSGGLLLLLGLLALWAELTPIYGQIRPVFCYLPPVRGPCRGEIPRFYYNPALNECQEFVYSDCGGNGNRFETEDDCKYTCAAGSLSLGIVFLPWDWAEKRGECPHIPQQHSCLQMCENDWNCAGEQKCCHYDCLSECKDPVYRKKGPPIRRLTRIGSSVPA